MAWKGSRNQRKNYPAKKQVKLSATLPLAMQITIRAILVNKACCSMGD
jgi:hypothetical protein